MTRTPGRLLRALCEIREPSCLSQRALSMVSERADALRRSLATRAASTRLSGGRQGPAGLHTRLVLVLALLVFAVLAATSSALACVVGTGTSASCTEAALNACLPGGGSFNGTVTFNCGGTATITVTSPKSISCDTTIDGGSVITISGGGTVNLFLVSGGITFTVQNLTMANGASGARPSGAIFNNGGNLTVTNSTFAGNSAGDGGAIVNNTGGNLTVTNSTFSDNSASGNNATGFGGAIFNSATLNVTNSTFSGNSAPGNSGGAILNNAFGTGTVTNSTFSDNSASATIGVGGAILNLGILTVTNSTFSGNSAGDGGAIDNERTVTVTNSILANSTGGNCGVFGAATITDGGHNIDDGSTCGFTGAGCANTTGTSFCNTNPLLDPAGLANNGGPTQAIALEAGSPAINAGDETVCAAPPVNNLDQRGHVRPGSGAASCSIGAYEFACDGSCPTTTTTTTSPPTTSTVPAPGPSTGDVNGSYCVRESWSVTVTGSRSFHRSGVVTGTIQVDSDGHFNLIYRHATPLPFGRTFGGISYDGSEYEVESQPVLANIAEHITARQFYALVNLAFAQILVPLEIAFPRLCYFPHIQGCLNEKGDERYSASGTSLSNLQGSGTASVFDDEGFELDFDVSSAAELSPGAGCGESEICDASCQGALSAAEQDLQAAAAAAAQGTGKIGRTLQALARKIAPALKHAEQQHPRRQAKAFAKVRSRLAKLRKAVARATRLSEAARGALEAAIDALRAILPS